MISATMMTEKEARSYIGKKYETQGKNKDLCTITEVFSIYNSQNKLASFMFESSHEFIGQKIINNDVPFATIKRGLRWKKYTLSMLRKTKT